MGREFSKAFRLLVGSGVLLVLQSGCGAVKFEEAPSKRAGFSFDKEGCSEDVFYQPQLTFGQKVDLLIVTDTSASLDRERQAVATQIDQFINKLPQGSDYQVAVMLAHLKPSNPEEDWIGRLYQAQEEPKVLASTSLSKGQIRKDLELKLTNITLDAYGTGGGESGIFSLTTALTTRYAENKSEGFFRQDAAWAVIFVSDENDICVPEDGAPQGEIDMYESHCTSEHTPENLYRTLITDVGDHSLAIGSIVHRDASEITDLSDGVGLGYIELTQANSGVLVPISDINGIAAGLAEIGNLMASRLNLITERRLYKYGEGYQIRVRVNHQLAPSDSFVINPHVPSIRLIDPSATGSANAVVSILNCEPWVDLSGF